MQTLLKAKAFQTKILGDLTQSRLVTIKKVNLPMIENKPSREFPNGRYVDSFSKDDLGSFRVVVENKKIISLLTKEILEEACNISKSIKDNGLENKQILKSEPEDYNLYESW